MLFAFWGKVQIRTLACHVDLVYRTDRRKLLPSSIEAPTYPPYGFRHGFAGETTHFTSERRSKLQADRFQSLVPKCYSSWLVHCLGTPQNRAR
eukprot:3329756-Amphidinium_carterae.1